MKIRFAVIFLTFSALFSPLGALASDHKTAKRVLTVDDYATFKSIGSPVFSEDGLWLAYTVESGDYEKNQSLTRIWMQPAQGGAPIALTAAAVSSWSPVFSEDGKKLYFLSARGEEKTQLWSLNLVAGGEPMFHKEAEDILQTKR